VIQSVKGIGLKTAQRVILDLKDKILKVADSENDIFVPSGSIQKEEALAALEVLGISRKLAEKTVDKFVSENPQATAENIIKQVLKSL
jgi:holliday junction DNA helicase RuvA